MPTKHLKKSAKENLIFLMDLTTIAMVVKGTKFMEDEPQTVNKAWNHPNPKLQLTQQEAVQKEFNNMKKWEVCWKTLKSLMPPNFMCEK